MSQSLSIISSNNQLEKIKTGLFVLAVFKDQKINKTIDGFFDG